MKIKKILSLLLCLCMIASFIPFVAKKAEAASLPTDINGKEWAVTYFANWNSGATKFEGSNRVVFNYAAWQTYGSDLLDGKPVINNSQHYFVSYNEIKYNSVDNFGNSINCLLVSKDKADEAWTITYKDTTSNADRYTICMSDGKTYLKDSSNAVDGKLSTTTNESDATWWDIRNVSTGELSEYSIGKDKSGKDPHIIFNYKKLSDNDWCYTLDCALNKTDNVSMFVEMPWYTTTFHNENGSTYKQDTRQIGTFKAPASPADKTGYTFVGWTDVKGSTKVVYKTLDDIKPTSSKDYYPVYTPHSYTVRFYSDSDLLGDYVEQSFTYDVEQALKMNTFTSPTGDFKNWKDAADGSKTYENGQAVKNLTAEDGAMITLYAEWNEYFYTVAFSGNYGTGSVPSKRVRYSELFTLPDGTEFTRENYKFIGWNTKADGSGNGYSAGQSVNKLTAERNGQVTLYAIWEAQHVHSVGEWETVKYATCTESGEKVKKCSDCKMVIETEAIPALGHSENDFSIINKEASCNGAGEKVWYCDRCGKPTRSEAVDATGHIEGKTETKILPTCTADGVNVVKCETCGVVIREEKVAALGHKPGAFVTTEPAACGKTGLKVQKCETCGVVIAEETIAAGEHIPGLWQITKDCTCTEAGLKQQACAKCGALIGEPVVIEPHEHQLGGAVTHIEATCTKAGEKVKVCTVCDAIVETEEIAKLGHTAGAFITEKAATCTAAGLKVQKCETCGVTLAEEEIPAKGHTKGSYYVTTEKATCNDDGERVYYCETCGVPVATEAVSAKGHKVGAFKTVLEPTCTVDGRKEQKCETCGIVLQEEAIPAKGHTCEAWITTLEPTCVNAGERVCKCDTCDKIYKTERIEPLGHKPGPKETCVDDQVCLTCGEVLEKADGRSHTWSEWATSKEAGFFTERQERRFCTSCNKEEFRYVSGTAGCHKYFPHVDGDNCGACNVLHNVNAFFRGVAKVFGFIIFGNIGTNILFPWLHKHFHHWFNPNK